MDRSTYCFLQINSNSSDEEIDPFHFRWVSSCLLRHTKYEQNP